ncbi:hypothetical protein PsYK624_063450 [Phanerochaete sordida]|uniref:Uncharacterized protein n=1 Tax=Phanerochaete sordida TaxID=48140 RepID=A0A9P3G8F9_9APHY|nr:hypothetical protein PsYK624_063450 [Phanerochaete sordida]
MQRQGAIGVRGAAAHLADFGLAIGQPCLVRGLGVVSGSDWSKGRRIVSVAPPMFSDWRMDGSRYPIVRVEVPARLPDGTASSDEFVIRTFHMRFNEIGNPDWNRFPLPALDATMARAMIRERTVLVPVCTRIRKMSDLATPDSSHIDLVVGLPAIQEPEFKPHEEGPIHHTQVSYVHMHARGNPHKARDTRLVAAPVVLPLWNVDRLRKSLADGHLPQRLAHDLCDEYVFATPPPEARAALLADTRNGPPTVARAFGCILRGELEALMPLPQDDPRRALLHNAFPAFECPCRDAREGGHVYCQWFADPTKQTRRPTGLLGLIC